MASQLLRMGTTTRVGGDGAGCRSAWVGVRYGVRRWRRATVAILLLAGLAACSLGSSPAISRQSLAERIANGTAPVILDVRSPSEYRAAHVPGAINIPFQAVGARYGELSLSTDATIVVYCAHGPRAAWAGHALREAGYSHVLYLEGHMTAWRKDGLPTETASAPADDAASEDDAAGKRSGCDRGGRAVVA
jgi:rhodanese-related sulfurtransferase